MLGYSKISAEDLDIASADVSGPFFVINMLNQMTVKSISGGFDNLDAAMRRLNVIRDCALPHDVDAFRIVTEEDAQAYIKEANADYRAWWQGGTFSGPSDWFDGSRIARKYPPLSE